MTQNNVEVMASGKEKSTLGGKLWLEADVFFPLSPNNDATKRSWLVLLSCWSYKHVTWATGVIHQQSKSQRALSYWWIIRAANRNRWLISSRAFEQTFRSCDFFTFHKCLNIFSPELQTGLQTDKPASELRTDPVKFLCSSENSVSVVVATILPAAAAAPWVQRHHY